MMMVSLLTCLETKLSYVQKVLSTTQSFVKLLKLKLPSKLFFGLI